MAKVRSHVDEKELFAGIGGSNLLAGKPKEDNLRILFLGAAHIKEKLTGATLPAFDEDLDTVDEAYPTSVVPCWTTTPDAPRNPRDFVPSPWAVPLMFYTFVGPENRHFCAPQNRAKLLSSYDNTPDQSMLRDPFNDVRMLLKRGDQKTFEYYTKGGATTSPLLPSRSVKFLSFAKVHDRNDKNPRVVIIARTSTCRDFEIAQMRWAAEGNPRQSKYPRYLLGDVTSPSDALVWYVDKFKVDPKDPQETNVLRWTEEMQVLDPNARTMKFSDEDLKLRFTFVDDACWYIPTYQEMLDVLVNELTDIPLETIKEACGKYGDVGEREGERTTRRQPGSRSGPPPEDDETVGVLKSMSRQSTLTEPPMPPDYVDDDIPFDSPAEPADSVSERGQAANAPVDTDVAPPTPVDDAPPPPPDDEPPAPPVDAPPPPPEPEFWVCVPGGKPVKMTKAAALNQVPGTKVNINGAWELVVSAFGSPEQSSAPAPAPSQKSVDAGEVSKTIGMILTPSGAKLDSLSAGQRSYVVALAEESVRQRTTTGNLSPELLKKLTHIASGGTIPEA